VLNSHEMMKETIKKILAVIIAHLLGGLGYFLLNSGEAPPSVDGMNVKHTHTFLLYNGA
jgi:hypothetical protein